jgi:RsiW-degrading membrane proteinase PrsW (M82 family)
MLLGLLYWDLSRRQWHIELSDDATAAWQHVVLILWAITLPALAGSVYLHNRDRYHDASWQLLAKLFVLGALSAPLAGLGEWVYYLGMSHPDWVGTRVEEFFEMYFVVAVAEEVAKFAVVWLVCYRSPLFKQVYDGVLFCAASALGFGTLENVVYAFTGGDIALGIAVMRALTPMHLIFGVVMGYGMGRARAVRGTPREVEWLAIGLVSAIALHGTWNFLIGFRSAVSALNLIVWIGGWVAAFKVVRKALVDSPFVQCSRCRHVIPRMASYCPRCGRNRRIYLRCGNCGEERPLGERVCRSCHTRLRRPWHLEAGRLPDLYPGADLALCPVCDAPMPPGSHFCLQCGERVESQAS